MFFERFFKPKWQHANPQVRKQAVLKLSSQLDAHRDLLLTLAADDPADEVRRSAVKRVSDFGFLRLRAGDDPNAGVREVASARYRQLLAGGTEDSDLALRLRELALCADDVALAYVARRGREIELRLAALERLGAEPVLEDAALNDASPKVRQAAASRLREPAALERLLRQSKERDRKVWRIARDALDALKAAAEVMDRDHAERERIIDATLALADSPWREGYAAEKRRLENRWQALAIAAQAEPQARFDLAQARCAERLAAHAARPEQAPAAAAVPAQATAKPAPVAGSISPAGPDTAALLAAVTAEPPFDAAGLSELENALAGLESTADAEARRRLGVLRGYLAAARAYVAREQELRAALDAAAGVDPSDGPALSAAGRPLRRLLDRLPWDGALPVPAPALLVAARRELDELVAREERAAAQRLTALEGVWEQLDQQLAGGHLRPAQRLMSRAQQALDQLPARARPAQERRLKAYQGQVAELRDWRRFATLPKQTELCERMEALVDMELAPPERAEQVKALQEAWKAIGGSDSAEAQQLWERFRSAGDQAFEPCRGYFSELARQRELNLVERRRIGEQLEAFMTQADWEGIDLKALEAIRGQARREWQAAMPVERKPNEPVQRRFEALMDELSRRIRDKQDVHRQRKQALVAQAQALLDAEDLRAATDKVKQLQASWREAGPLPAAQDRKLWREFKAACDGVFERRQQLREQSDQERQANLLQVEAVCIQLEALGGEARAEPETARTRLRELEAAFEAAGALPREQARALQLRFRAAREALLGQLEEGARHRQRAAQAAVAARALLCARLEAAVIAGQAERLDPLRAEYAALGVPRAAPAEVLDGRWRQALAAAEAGGFGSEEITAAQTRRRELCVRLEILAGVESPDADRALRMDLQVRRLAEGMGGGERLSTREEAQALELEWLGLGPVAQPGDALEDRVQLALRQLEA